MFNFKKINLLQAFVRFPIVSVLAIVATLIGMYVIDFPNPPTVHINIMFCCIIGALCNIALTIAKESYGWSTANHWIGRLVIVAFLVVFYFGFLPSSYDNYNTSLFRLPFQLGAIFLFLHLLISYIPFFNKGSEEDFWEYNKDLFLNIVESGFYSGFLFVGLSIALLALVKLFGLDLGDLVYPRLFFFLIGIFNTLYFLSKYPTVFYDNEIKTPIKAFLIFSQYILIPLVLVYMAILYAYGLQIAFKWELPEGWVSQLSLWFSVVGIFAFLLNYFNHKFSDFKLTAYFKKYFFLVLLLPIVLVFIAIYWRISEYGVTELRYVVALLGVWLLGVVLYFNLSKKKNIRVIPMSLSLFVLIPILLGPLNMFNATLSSQKKQFKNLLIDNGCLVDQEFIAIKDSDKTNNTRDIIINGGVKDQSLNKGQVIYSAIRFLDNRSDLSFVNDWIEPDLDFINDRDPRAMTDTLDQYHNARVLAEKLNLASFVPRPYVQPKGERFNFNQVANTTVELDSNKFFFPIDIHQNREYDKRFYFKINEEKTGLSLYERDKFLKEISLTNFINNQFTEQDSTTNSHINYVLNSSTIMVQDSTYEVALILTNLGGFKTTEGDFKIDNIWGHAILEFKEKQE